MNLKDPNVQKILLGVVVLVVLSYLYFGTQLLPFFYQARRAEIKALDEEYAKLSADLEKARQTVGKLAQLEAEYERLHEQWLSAQELLPEEQEMPDLLRKVTTAGVRAGVEFMLFQPGSPVLHEQYKEHPVKIRVRGGYHQLGIFLSRLANLERIVNVSELDIKSAVKAARGRGGKNKDENARNSIVADFTLTAHTLIGGVENEMVAEQQ
ncbi:MAG: type 4a pilus biogenesis protein PilO [Candidatus Krumholzibacteria bacterium]|nr:type 4a pilus biogenesis protein PilO [Candidatus Krumholzibacteria bacterium]